MTLQTGTDPMITHPLSSVYGMYVVEFDGVAQFCTADPELLFQNLEGVKFKDCGKVRVIILSSEDWSRDDITAFVWEAMTEHYAGTTDLPETADEWDDIYDLDVPFVRWGFGDLDHEASRERVRRKEEASALQIRLAKFSQHAPALAIAAE